jgi:hypothetical protein
MRLLAFGLIVFGLSVYAWKDWYQSLCGLIVLTAILEHPDMPKAMFEVPGLNPWNLLFFTILLAWIFQRSRQKLRWDMPKIPALLLFLGMGVILLGFLRLVSDRQGLIQDWAIAQLLSEYLFNPLKWVVLGLLLFDGCRTRGRLVLGLASILSLYFLLSLQVLRWVVPAGALAGGPLSPYTLNTLRKEVGYHRTDLSVMLAGASWALLALRPLVSSLSLRIVMVLGSLTILFAQVLTGGRGGYLAWAVVGLTLGLVRWRRYLLLAPLIMILVLTLVPSAGERALEGLRESAGTSDEVDIEELTAGRNLIWPQVIEKIWDAPFLGYGRAAMQRTGLTAWFAALEDEDANVIQHPHNAYLEMLLDSGVAGLFVTVALYGMFLAVGFSLFRDHRSPEFIAMGGIGLALTLSQLLGAFTGQSFWPREATVGMWCAIGLLLRVWVQRLHVYAVSRPRDPSGRVPLSDDRSIWQPVAPAPTRHLKWWRRNATSHAIGLEATPFRPRSFGSTYRNLPRRSPEQRIP